MLFRSDPGRGVGDQGDRDRPFEEVTLVAGVFAGGLGELSGECVGEPGRAFGVALVQDDREVVGRGEMRAGEPGGPQWSA